MNDIFNKAHSHVLASTYTNPPKEFIHGDDVRFKLRMVNGTPMYFPSNCCRAQPKLLELGCTATLALYQRGRLVVAHCGDSLAVLGTHRLPSRGVHSSEEGQSNDHHQDHDQGAFGLEELDINSDMYHGPDLHHHHPSTSGSSSGRTRPSSCQQEEEQMISSFEGHLLTDRHHGHHQDEKNRIETEYGHITGIGNDGYIRVLQGPFQGYQLGVTRSIGHRLLEDHGVIPDPTVSVVECPEEACCLVVATDGVWDCLSPEEAVRHVMLQAKLGATAAEAAESLAKQAIDIQTIDSGSSDNTSVGVLFLDKEHLINRKKRKEKEEG